MARWSLSFKASPIRSGTALRIATGVIPILLFACGQSAPVRKQVPETGGTIDAGATSVTGGAPASGGQHATGGSVPTGGTTVSGGVTATGGLAIPSGGTTTMTGGTTIVSGGTTVSGGVTSTGGLALPTGGITTMTGGNAGIQSTDAGTTGGTQRTGGTAVTGGNAGTGGTMATGGNSTMDAGTVTPTGGSTTVFPPRFVGNIDTHNNFRADFPTYWQQFTPENAGKWSSVQASSKELFNWAALDALYKQVVDNNLIFKEHCFVWGSAQPMWQTYLDETTAPLAVKAWMKNFCDRYPKTQLIDVVNEPPPHTTPPYANKIGGGNRTTWDWIANSFKWAREACPNAVLLLNDYNNLEYDTDVQGTIDIVKAIQKLNAPIDAIGCQTHEGARFPASTIKANIDKIVAATGLPIYITEFDIGLADEEQKQKYMDYFPMFMDHPAIKGVTIWGYIVGATWRANTGLVTTEGTMRPAMTWLMDFLNR